MSEELMQTKAIGTNPETPTVKKNESINIRNQTVYHNLPDIFIHPADEDVTPEVVMKFINLHKSEQPRYKKLMNMYKGKYDIFSQKEKEEHKPDNRVAVNFVKYLVDSFSGYSVGLPPKISHPNKAINENVKTFNKRNDIDDIIYEQWKLCSIYGRAYAIEYQGEDTETYITFNSPEDMFIVYDDTVQKNPLFAVRHYIGDEGIKGELYTLDSHYLIEPSKGDVGIALVDDPEVAFYYNELSVIEFIENEERMSLCESVISNINNYNKALSEKGNDVDYFADAYLAVLGAPLDSEGIKTIRDNRIINIYGESGQYDASKLEVKFLEKPNADETQENYLNRLEKLIFQIAMIVNIDDDDFGSASSGESLAYKVMNMSNLALTKERKFKKALNKVYKMFFSVPLNFDETVNMEELNGELANEWFNLEYRFIRNTPKNIKEESETASNLQGVVSKETQLSVLSIVDDVQKEMNRIETEKDESSGNSGYETDENGDFIMDSGDQ